jgi:ATP-dependent RNA circularization protein (DNA/RNA ligase family)
MIDLEQDTKLLYPKIETAFIRGDDSKFIKGEDVFEVNLDTEGKRWLEPGYVYSNPEFNEIATWDVTEKIHGFHVRVALVNRKLYFLGKTETTKLPEHLLKKLRFTFLEGELIRLFGGDDVCLYGVVSGVKIRNSLEAKFNLFDVNVSDSWLTFKEVLDVAEELNTNIVPYLGAMKIEEILKIVKSDPPLRRYSLLISEGIVARAKNDLKDPEGERLIFKLKHEDFKEK